MIVTVVDLKMYCAIRVTLRPLKQVLCLDDLHVPPSILNPMFCTVSNKRRSGWTVLSGANRWVYSVNLFKPLRQDHWCQSQSGRSRNPKRSWQSEGMFGFSLMTAFSCLHYLPADSGLHDYKEESKISGSTSKVSFKLSELSSLSHQGLTQSSERTY